MSLLALAACRGPRQTPAGEDSGAGPDSFASSGTSGTIVVDRGQNVIAGHDQSVIAGHDQSVIAGHDRQSPDSFAPGASVPASLLSVCDTAAFFSAAPVDSVVLARMSGRSYKDGCPVAVEDLRYLRVLHMDLDGRTLIGEMVCNKSIADDLLEIFRALYDAGYPIESMRLIDDYDADDEASMAANNSSCFNYRRKSGMSAVSRHAYGEAVDINPLYNPYYRVTSAGGHIVEPASAAPYVDRSADFPYKIERGDLCHRLFLEHGFHWGGSWTRSKDYQHFER